MNVSFQLYSARNFTPWADVLSTLAKHGYKHVEGFGGNYEDVTAFKAMLDANGLSMESGHFSIDALENDFDGVLATAREFGMARIYCPHLVAEERPADAIGWAAFAARLELVGEKVRAAGFDFGWHNHDFEFSALPDGSLPMQLILDKAPSISWEADIAWIVRGGSDPLDWIARYGSRITSAHVKDIAAPGECVDEDGWADVGHGVMAWKAIYAALQEAGVKLYVMEHDNPSDNDRFARRSIESFRAL